MANRTMVKTVVKNYIVEGHTYSICLDDQGDYWGFDHKDIDETGKTKKEYNGITGNLGKTLVETMRRCYVSARVENEINRELIRANDLDEIMKMMKITEDSMNIVA